MANCCCCWLCCCCCCCVCCSSSWNNFICSFWVCIWDISYSVWALWASRYSLLSWSSCSFISRIFSPFSLNHSIASPGLLLFFSFFPSSFSVSSYLFLVWLNLSIALSLISIAFFFSRSHSFLAQHFCSFAFSDSIYNSTHSSTSFSASLISSSPAATARKSLTFFSLVHTIIDLMSIINKRFWEKWLYKKEYCLNLAFSHLKIEGTIIHLTYFLKWYKQLISCPQNYNHTASVKDMIRELGWVTLEKRPMKNRLTKMCKSGIIFLTINGKNI